MNKHTAKTRAASKRGSKRTTTPRKTKRPAIEPKPWDPFSDGEYLAVSLMDDVGMQLRAAIKRTGVSQSVLAKRMGVTRQQINLGLSSEWNMTLRMLGRLAAALRLKPQVVICKPEERVEIVRGERPITFACTYFNASKLEYEKGVGGKKVVSIPSSTTTSKAVRPEKSGPAASKAPFCENLTFGTA